MNYEEKLAEAASLESSARTKHSEMRNKLKAASTALDTAIASDNKADIYQAKGNHYAVSLEMDDSDIDLQGAIAGITELQTNEEDYRALYDKATETLTSIKAILSSLEDENKQTLLAFVEEAIDKEHRYYPFFQQLKELG